MAPSRAAPATQRSPAAGGGCFKGLMLMFSLATSLLIGILIGFNAREATDGFLGSPKNDQKHASQLTQIHAAQQAEIEKLVAAMMKPGRKLPTAEAKDVGSDGISQAVAGDALQGSPRQKKDAPQAADSTGPLIPWSMAEKECFQLASGSSDVFVSVRAEHRAWPASQGFAGDNVAFVSSFRVVKALNGNSAAYSLESCKHRGRYLRFNGNNIVVEPPKAPAAAVWYVNQETEEGRPACVRLEAATWEGHALRLEEERAPEGRLEMMEGSGTCLQLRRPPMPLLPSPSDPVCAPERATDALKVASMADGGQPCGLIPTRDCEEGDLPGAAIGEHSLCNTKAIRADLKNGECLVYGIGISDNWDFEMAMAEKGCEVHAFDPTIDKPPSDESKRLPNLHFHQWGLSGVTLETGSHKVAGVGALGGRDTMTSQPMYTLDDMMKKLGHSKRRLSVFKIDCEGCEWASMAAVPDSLWSRIDQLSLELHYGKELLLDTKDQLRKAAAFADALRSNGFRDYRSDVRDGYAHHQELMPELFEAGMPHGFCCRLSGFIREPEGKVPSAQKTPEVPKLPPVVTSDFMTWADVENQECFELVNSDTEVRLSTRSETRAWPASGAFAGETTAFASSFRKVPPVASGAQGFSLESCRNKGYFLRHNGNNIVVEPPKSPLDAVWTISDSKDAGKSCVMLQAANLKSHALRIDAEISPGGKVELDPRVKACLRLARSSTKPKVSASQCASNDVSDAVKVASMADGQPCNLIPVKSCPKELVGTSIGEHGLCSTPGIEKDLADGKCLVYGVGISDNWDFEKAMAKMGCEVHAFDPTIDRPPTDESQTLPNLHFHKWGLSGKTLETGSHKVAGTKSGATETSNPFLTVVDIMERLGHKDRRLSVFKVDCEGCEWESLAAVPGPVWGRIDQISFEVHYGKELMLDSPKQLKNAATVADMLRAHGFADWRNDWRDGYESHRALLPELYEAGMPRGFCCRLSGFAKLAR